MAPALYGEVTMGSYKGQVRSPSDLHLESGLGEVTWDLHKGQVQSQSDLHLRLKGRLR